MKTECFLILRYVGAPIPQTPTHRGQVETAQGSATWAQTFPRRPGTHRGCEQLATTTPRLPLHSVMSPVLLGSETNIGVDLVPLCCRARLVTRASCHPGAPCPQLWAPLLSSGETEQSFRGQRETRVLSLRVLGAKDGAAVAKDTRPQIAPSPQPRKPNPPGSHTGRPGWVYIFI